MGLDPESQRRLLLQAREGVERERRRALAELLSDYRGPALAAIHRTLARCGLRGAGAAAAAEEALQEAILRFLAGGIEAFRGESSLRTYFVRIAVNAALDAVRRGLRETDLEAAPELTGRERDAEGELAAAELRVALQRCLEALGPRYRRSVELYYLEEAGDCATCARIANSSTAAFMQQLSRARLALADCLRRRLSVSASRPGLH
jgi:RNA polymerase sigma factor (sigma-70 family)